jgi:pilus assembly protein CpaD
MSSNRTRIALALLAGSFALATAACGVTSIERKDVAMGVTPTEQYPLSTVSRPQGILLAPRAGGLSEAQAAALTQVATDWRDRGDGLILIEAPTGGGPNASATAYAARQALETFGVPHADIDMIGYEDRVERAPIRISFLGLEGRVEDCGKTWGDLTKSGSNQPSKTFGCAVNSNLAAMIVDPVDINRARASDPYDAGRRQVIIDKYRAGTKTSAEIDEQADGVVSRAID